MKRYIVAVSGLTDIEETEFIEFARANELKWWHYIGNFWLLIDPNENLDAARIRDKLHAMKSSMRCIVIENPDNETWAGFGPKEKHIFDWVKKNLD
jgi:hypothetical protein